jgi:hypothetical protein
MRTKRNARNGVVRMAQYVLGATDRAATPSIWRSHMTSRIFLTNTTALLASLLLASLWPSSAAYAFSDGAPNGYSASPASFGESCLVCHASFPLNSGPGSITILDLPALYVPSQTYSLRVRIEDADQAGAGFQLSVENTSGSHIGELAVSDPTNTKNAGGSAPEFITHTSTGKAESIASWAAMGNAAEFTLQWQAPATGAGEIGFYAAGAAINDGTASSNDDVYTTAQMRTSADLGDLNGDGSIDVADLGMLLTVYGTNNPVSDMNNDGIVDAADLGILLGAFGS